MYLLIAFISKVEKTQEIINRMKEEGFTGGTWLDGVGMRNIIPKAIDMPIIASLSSLFEDEGDMNKNIIEDHQTGR